MSSIWGEIFFGVVRGLGWGDFLGGNEPFGVGGAYGFLVGAENARE